MQKLKVKKVRKEKEENVIDNVGDRWKGGQPHLC